MRKCDGRRWGKATEPSGSSMSKQTELPNSRVSPRFAGLVTFGRYPQLDDVKPENRPVDWAIYGAPFDGGVTYRPGARFGPRTVRDESQYLKRYSMVHGVDVCGVLSMADAGDAPVSPYSCRQTAEMIGKFAAGLPDQGVTKALAIGGDHSIAYANIRAAWERSGSKKSGLALLHFDSHLDTVDEVWGEKWGHASPFRRCVEEGLVDPKRMLSIGIKGPLNTASDLEYARDHGVRIVTPGELAAKGDGVIRQFVREIGDAPAYLSFDIDCVDPAYAPGTGTPSVGGFTSAQALDLVRACVGVNLVGADVVEVLPDRDHAGITALLAAHVAFEILSLDAATKTKA